MMTMDADYTFELNFIKTCAPQFKWLNKSFLDSVYSQVVYWNHATSRKISKCFFQSLCLFHSWGFLALINIQLEPSYNLPRCFLNDLGSQTKVAMQLRWLQVTLIGTHLDGWF